MVLGTNYDTVTVSASAGERSPNLEGGRIGDGGWVSVSRGQVAHKLTVKVGGGREASNG